MGILTDATKEIIVDCVVKPIIGATVSAVALSVAQACCDKIRRNANWKAIERKRKDQEAPKVTGLLV